MHVASRSITPHIDIAPPLLRYLRAQGRQTALCTLPCAVSERGGWINRITCWQDNRGEGSSEFSVLRARASRSETHRCRTAPWLSIAGNAGVALSSSNVELCWIFFVRRGESGFWTSPRSSLEAIPVGWELMGQRARPPANEKVGSAPAVPTSHARPT